MQHTLQNHACTIAAFKLHPSSQSKRPCGALFRLAAGAKQLLQLFESSLVLTMLSCGISTVFMRGFLLVLTHSASWKSPCTCAWRGTQGATGSVYKNDIVSLASHHGLCLQTLYACAFCLHGLQLCKHHTLGPHFHPAFSSCSCCSPTQSLQVPLPRCPLPSIQPATCNRPSESLRVPLIACLLRFPPAAPAAAPLGSRPCRSQTRLQSAAHAR